MSGTKKLKPAMKVITRGTAFSKNEKPTSQEGGAPVAQADRGGIKTILSIP
jgi:hypothetical protein